MREVPRVVILPTGGTIDSVYVPGKGLQPVKRKSNVKSIGGYEVPLFQVCNLDSTEITDYIRNHKIGPEGEKWVRRGYHIVYPHGTDTMVKTACVMEYNLPYLKRRIVFTGSLYDSGSPVFDGPKNEHDAVIFAARGYRWSGVFIVMGGNVLYPEIWGKHLYRFHNPVLEVLRLGEPKLRSMRDFDLREPIDPVAKIREEEIIPCMPYRPKFDETTYLSADGYFSVTEGGEDRVRGLDFRGYSPFTGKVAEINNILSEYSKLKEMAINYRETKDIALSRVEDLLKSLRVEPDIFTKYWKDLDPKFDPRTNLEKILMIGDPSTNPEGFIKGIKDGIWSGVVVRGFGYGHLNLKKEWKKFLRTTVDYNVPVCMTTDEGVITAMEYEVSRPPLKYRSMFLSGTRNAEESQCRTATSIGDESKKEFVKEIGEMFDVHPLDILGAFNVSGSLFKTPEERVEWTIMRKYSTNADIAASPLFVYEEKILLSALNCAYVSGKLKRREKE